MTEFSIIQGGMGVGVSGWKLAKAVAERGQLGVVSGTGIAVVVARRLQMGDEGGHVRRALGAFPIPEVAERILARHYVAGGKSDFTPFLPVSMPTLEPGTSAEELMVVANFVEVYLAKEGHKGLVGINYLEKIQLPHVSSLFGAMLAGVDYVLMVAGIPRHIPGVLDALAEGKEATYRIDADGAVGDEFVARFDPAVFCKDGAPKLKRPKFLAIVSSATLAMTLARKSNGKVDGFVVEGDTAGGHNAPPRGPMQLNERGEPIYGERDNADLKKIAEIGLPFYLAGGYGRPGKLAQAKALGASGIQVGTAFAFCEESSIEEHLKRRIIERSCAGMNDVLTDPHASPTGFPLKVLQLDGTLSEPEIFESRERVCDMGYLRRPYRREDGKMWYRCAAEPVAEYVRKGGKAEDAVGRKCLCNGLFANIGLPQVRKGLAELPLITAGDDAGILRAFVREGAVSYTASEVMNVLLGVTGVAETRNPGVAVGSV